MRTQVHLVFVLVLACAKPNLAHDVDCAADNIVTVATDLGLIRGQTVNPKLVDLVTNSKSIHQFLGIPYAAPPVGNLRFKKPEPVKAWAPEIQDGRNWSPVCFPAFSNVTDIKIPKIGNYSEDCLSLNIWTPSLMRKQDNLKPVYIWIHWGGFTMGSAVGLDGAVIAATQDIVYVTLNYRLGPFGFLVSPPGVNEELQAPGNVGLWDQVAALEWIKDHISNFGGNPDQITIGGASAGAWSASLLTHSPIVRSKNLFKAVILQSGSSLAPRVIQNADKSINRTRILAENLNCPINDDSSMMQCLQSADAEKFILNFDLVKNNFVHEEDMLPLTAGPIHDNDLLSEEKSEQDNSGLRVLTGITNHEGGLARFMKLSENQKWQKFLSSNDDVQEWILELEKYLIQVEHVSRSKAEEISKFYFQNSKNDSKSDLETVIFDFIGDRYFNCPMRKENEQLQKNGAKIYQYLSTYKSTRKGLFTCPGEELVCHGEDMGFLLGQSLMKMGNKKSDINDQRQALETLNTIGKFVRDEKIDVQTADGKVLEWPIFDLETRKSFEFNVKKQDRIISDFRGNFCDILSK